MSMFFSYCSFSPEQTIIVGMLLSSKLQNDAFVMLYGDIGSGKTSFVKGLAWGFGISNIKNVSSPTYTLVNRYNCNGIMLHHVDLYRSTDNVDLYESVVSDFISDEGIKVIEWSERLDNNILPDERWEIKLVIINAFKRLIKVKSFYKFDL